MGVTGAGKSAFISTCTQESLPDEAHSLFSCTTKVTVHTTVLSGRTIHLIDTPGFDDSGRSDEEILQELAYWLTAATERDLQLSGIIYLHRITDVRLQGSALRSLRALRSICGDQNIRGVIVATTMWDQLEPDMIATAFSRHEKLRKKILDELGDNGARIVALSDGRAAALELVEHFVREGSRMMLAFQHQLMKRNATLLSTDVGKLLAKEWQGQFSHYRDAIESAQSSITAVIEDRKSEGRSTVRDIIDNAMMDSMEPMQKRLEAMKEDIISIRQSWEKKLIADRKALERASRENEDSIQIRQRALEELFRSEQLSRQPEVAHQLEASLVGEIDDLGHRGTMIMSRQRNRLDRRWTPIKGPSGAMEILGAGLAVGQIVAMACVVM
ncbi:P-loop containing nucleoside triphosphate hydrolase protein [Paraphoma chrysanthemicola]|uniref:P-loop containing nucleoside triphosphate hydrolase protein n=1 Tax=Paraphoma chrysanthemicola TaxID=798071 RepID=A0A8K0RG03_9PLEO|nr:P-loop containing nucleoside triphosphate hydrolase protein [Paraphoma chrysanthemicola]